MLDIHNRLYTIREAANTLGVSTKTLRRWDQRGRLVPTRTAGNQRRYSQEQIEKLKVSSFAKASEGQAKFKIAQEIPPLFSENEAPKEIKAVHSLPSALSGLPSGSFLKNHFLLKHANAKHGSAINESISSSDSSPEVRSHLKGLTLRGYKMGFVFVSLVLILSFGGAFALTKYDLVAGLTEKKEQFAKFLANLPRLQAPERSDGGQAQITFVPPDIVGAVLAAAAEGSDLALNINIPTFFSQNLGIGTAAPDASSILDLVSEDKGILPPRMTEAQIQAIPAPAAGLFVYNTDTNHYNMYNGTSWQGVFTSIGDSTTGEAFTETGASGTSLFFYDADGRGQLTIANLGAARKYTLPDAEGEISLLGQTIGNSELVNSKVTVSAGTNMTGGGAVALGSSVTLTLKDSIDLAGTLDVTGATTLKGALTLNGNATLGDAASDSITFTARVAQDSDIVPITATGTSDLGTSALPWDNVYADNVFAATSGTSGYWQRNSSAVSPTNITDDLLLGATSTASAKIAFINIAGGTPTATISANVGNNATTLTGTGVLGTTNMQTLTLGNSSTGNVVIDSGSSAITLSDDTTISGDLAVNGGTSADITSTTTTGTLFNTTVTTLSLGGAATTLNLGTTDSVTRTINLGTGTGADTINVGTGATTANTLNLGTGAVANTIAIGSSSTTTFSLTDDNWSISAAGLITTADDAAVNGGDLTTTATTFNLVNATATTVNFAGAGTTISIGATTGTTTISNATAAVTGNLTIAGTTGATLSGVGAGITFSGTGNHDITASAGTLRVGAFTVTGTQTLATGVDIAAAGAGSDIGSAGTRFGVIYADEVNATTLVGTLTGGNTNAATFTINADNATADTEDASLAFERGTTTPNALIAWDSTNDEIDVNTSLHLTTTILSSLPTLTLDGTQPASVSTTPGTAASAVVTISAAAGGNTTIATTGVGGIGSGIAWTLGTGGTAASAATTSTGGAGGAFAVTGGTGGAAAAAGTDIGGAGGALTLTGGAGGAATVGTSLTGGAGGAISITAGAAGTGGNANGGTLTLNSGAVIGTGTSTLNIGTASATAIVIGNATSNPTLSLAGTGTFSIAQTVINLTGSSPVLDLTSATTLSLNTTTNRPITTGTGLLTAGGALTVTGTLTANGIANIGDAGDAITLSGTTVTLTANAAGNDITFNLVDNNTDALDIQEGANNYLNINTADAGAVMQFGNAVTNPSFSFLGTGAVTIAGSADGTNALVLTLGDLRLTDGNLIVTAGDFDVTLDSGDGASITGTQPTAANPATNASTVLTVTGAKGGNASVVAIAGGVGAPGAITGGAGGDSAVAGVGTNTGGAGGALTFAAGAGGAASGGTVANNGGAGGAVSITAGAAGTGGNANGGTLTLNSGAVIGTGTSTLNIGTASATAIVIGNATSNPTLSINGTGAVTIAGATTFSAAGTALTVTNTGQIGTLQVQGGTIQTPTNTSLTLNAQGTGNVILQAGGTTVLTLDDASPLVVIAGSLDGEIQGLRFNNTSTGINAAIGIATSLADSAGTVTTFGSVPYRVEKNGAWTAATDSTKDADVVFRGIVNFAAQEYLRYSGTVPAVVFNEQAADIDFRVESLTNANMLVVDAGNNNVGIGSVPNSDILFDVSTTRTIGVGSASIRTSGTTTVSAAGTFRAIQLGALTLSTAASGVHTSIYGVDIPTPTLTVNGTASVTNFATLHIEDVPVGTATNKYALWVDAGTSRFDGVLLAELGSAAAAAYSFQSASVADADTGLFSRAANQFSATIGGVEAFRFDSASAATARWRLQAGTLLSEFASAVAIDSGVLSFQRFRGTLVPESLSALVAGDRIADINGLGMQNGTVSIATAIRFEADTGFNTSPAAADSPGRILFLTTLDGSNSLSERMRIDNAGNVGIGTTGPATILHTLNNTITGPLGITIENDGASTANLLMFRIIDEVGGANNVKFSIDSDGDLLTDGSTTIGTPADIAENYPVDDNSIEAGELVSTTSQVQESTKEDNGQIIAKETISILTRSKTPYDKNLIGVVSTNPGLILSGYTQGKHVALSGRVPVKVSLENGPIAVGDKITSSSIPGIGMKATQAGRVIGIALEPFDGSQPQIQNTIYKILVFVNPHWMGTDKLLALDGNNNLGIGTATPSFKLDVQDMQIATAAARIFNTNSGTDADGLIVKLGNTSTSAVATTNSFISFETSGIGVVGSISGNGAKGVTYATSGVADFAEYFRKDQNQTIPFGSVVCLNDNGLTVPCSSASGKILGIASERPAFLGGENLGAGSVAVGLVGQVETLVSNANGEILPGDALTSSDIPGVAVKATKAGQIVGKAVEGFVGTGQGRILVSVNVSWYDPTIYIASDGTLGGAVQNTQNISQAGESDVSDTQTVGSTDTPSIPSSLESDPLFKDLKDKVSYLQSKLDLLSLQFEQQASTSGILASQGETLQGETLRGWEASTSAALALGDVELNNATIAEDLMVLGRTTITSLGVTGNINAGLIAIHGLFGEINTLSGDLYLQKNGLSGVNILNGAIVIDTKGNMTIDGTITAKQIEAENYTVLGQQSIGSGTIPAGSTSIEVSTGVATSSSKIFLTTTSLTDKQITVVEKQTGKFTVAIPQPTASPISFDWWIVGNKN